jgi:hypothetical protein
MEAINRAGRDQQPNSKPTSSVIADGTKCEIIPRYVVTEAVLAKYLQIVIKAAHAAINAQASDPVEDAARALGAGFGAAMVAHGRDLNDDGYEHGDFECKASLGLIGGDGKESAQYHRI